MDENARKRKREEEGEHSDIEGIEKEKPREGLKEKKPMTKKQKKDEEAKKASSSTVPGVLDTSETGTAVLAPKKTKAMKQKEKDERKNARKEKKAAKSAIREVQSKQEIGPSQEIDTALGTEVDSDKDGGDRDELEDLATIDVRGIEDTKEDISNRASTASPSPDPESSVFDKSTLQSGTSSISSVGPSTFTSNLEKPKSEPAASTKSDIHKLKFDSQELKARLQARIDALRAKRKADPVDGAPARNRQELMEARRRKEEQRKAHKKELRLKAKEEERLQRDLALQRGSPALLSPALGSGSPFRSLSTAQQQFPPNNFSFGKIAFADGSTPTSDLSKLTLPASKPRKGPQDPQTALQAAAAKAARLSAFDPSKRADIEEKDAWLHAKQRAQGDRVRDDTSLLKKTLKRKEKAKRKSGKEWDERLHGVEKAIEGKQKRREENLRKRREEKGFKRGGKKGGSGSGKKSQGKSAKGKPKPRPGFEGTFKTGGGRK